MRFDEIFREMEELQKRMTRDMFKGFGSFDDMFSDFDTLRDSSQGDPSRPQASSSDRPWIGPQTSCRRLSPASGNPGSPSTT
jgi:hypothetical protein